jgi:hypothetical protein
MSRGLLTEAERAFLRGEKDSVDEQQYRYNVRSNFRSRMEQLSEDLELLREAGEDDLVEKFYAEFSRVERLEKELEALRAELEDERND